MGGQKRTSVLTTLAILACCFAIAQAVSVVLYEQKHFKGRHTTVDIRGCTNIPKEMDDAVSSIEPSQCVIIFKHENCKGPRVRLEPYAFGTAHLDEINFEDKISSVAPCTFSMGKDEH